ncbi:DUF6771 family protein [Novosphingobium humi]|uniref:DUF6771 family protein n=1 Tax=Novosphingobium humi TaxID=2282397 RepID=UPI0025B0B37C|nr:DUF6771 family protein [Novosphingobium humi]WJS98184.1 hypothetical protein NYQ05_13775 [Novosphingobium humi]
MERLDQSLIAEAILQAPGWARIGITAPSPVMREDAAAELARTILERAQAPATAPAPDQIGLGL